LLYTLDAAVIALKIRRKFSLLARASAERVNEAATRWTYGVFCSILLHDPGKMGAGVSLLAKTPDREDARSRHASEPVEWLYAPARY